MTTKSGYPGFGRAASMIFEGGTEHVFACLADRVVLGVSVSADKSKLTFKMKGGKNEVFEAVGDCCSSSWIEHLEVPKKLRGSKFTQVADGEAVPWDGHECVAKKATKDDEYVWGNECGHEHLQVYNTKLITDRGETLTIEYRNDSNGYYGGYLEHRT